LPMSRDIAMRVGGASRTVTPRAGIEGEYLAVAWSSDAKRGAISESVAVASALGGRSADIRVAAPRGRLVSASAGSGGSQLSRNTSASATERPERWTWRPRRCGCSAPRRRERCATSLSPRLCRGSRGCERARPQPSTARSSARHGQGFGVQPGGRPVEGRQLAVDGGTRCDGETRAAPISAVTGMRPSTRTRTVRAAPTPRSARLDRPCCSG
jgi:hypothetical protein